MLNTHSITLLAQDAPPSAFPGALLFAGVLLVCLVAWRSLRKKLKEHTRSAEEPAAEKIHRVRATATHDARNRIDSYMTDAEELTRRLAAILDNKAERAEQLIDRAEAKIAELDARLTNAHDAEPKITTSKVAPLSQTPDSIRYEPQDPVAVDIYRLADTGKTPVEIAKELDEHTGKVELILALRD